MDPYAAANPTKQSPLIYWIDRFNDRHEAINDAINQSDIKTLCFIAEKRPMDGAVNLSGDPLLSVLIAYEKSDLALQLMKVLSNKELKEKNHDGDTALHVAAIKGDMKVAMALAEKDKEFLHETNNNMETALHKAALYGNSEMLWMLEEKGGWIKGRRGDGGTILHCAIMGNAPGLALEIVKKFDDLKSTRNSTAVTPLQLMVTIPYAFRSKTNLGPLEEIIYNWLPLEDDVPTHMTQSNDEEKNQPVGAKDAGKGQKFVTKYRKRFPPNYDALFDMLSFIILTVSIGAKWIKLLVFRILKQSFALVEAMEQQKIKHKQAMDLVKYLACDPKYWDFIVKGSTGISVSKDKSKTHPRKRFIPRTSSNTTTQDSEQKNSMANEDKDKNEIKQELVDVVIESVLELCEKLGLNEYVENILKALPESNYMRWDESPLTLGAKLGLYEFVEAILNVCPQSATYLDYKGRNILQIAIENGQEEIVRKLGKMATGANPKLPSWLLSNIDKDTKNTILHFAAEKMVKDGAGSLQMQNELQWFERVKNMLPKDLEYSRNASELTAQELFTEKHKDMIKDAKNQLMEMGTACSSLVAAVVFASSFSIPGDKDEQTHIPIYYKRLAFWVFTHFYVFGLSCASTALVLFLSLLTSPYKEHDFRRSVPTKYFFANASFFVALVALLVAFTCNIYLTIYGAMPETTMNIFPLVGELISVPILCFCVLVYRGATFGIVPFLQHFWR